MTRKPLEPNCDGGVFCPVEGHVTARATTVGMKFSHVALTAGQSKTLMERARLAREQNRKLRADR